MISIIVPVYNAAKTIRECIESILVSTYPDFELLLIDDGSTDNSCAIIESYAQNDARIKLHRKQNGGTSSARNMGISVAVGRYIGFADNDDQVHPRMFEVLVDGFKKFPDADIACCKFKAFTNPDDLHNEEISNVLWKTFDTENAIKEYLLAETFSMSVWDKLFRKELFEHVKFDENHYYEDKKASYDLIKSSKVLVSTDKELYYYFVHPKSKARTSKIEHLRDYVYISDTVVADILSVYPHFSNEYNLHYRIAKDNYSMLSMLLKRKGIDANYLKGLQKKMRKNRSEYMASNYVSTIHKIKFMLLTFIPKSCLVITNKLIS